MLSIVKKQLRTDIGFHDKQSKTEVFVCNKKRNLFFVHGKISFFLCQKFIIFEHVSNPKTHKNTNDTNANTLNK